MFQCFNICFNDRVKCLVYDTADSTLEECVSAALLYKLGKVVEIQGVTDVDYPAEALGMDLYNTALTALRAGQFLQFYTDEFELRKYAVKPNVFDIRLRDLGCGKRAIVNRSVNIPLGVTTVEQNPLKRYTYGDGGNDAVIDEIVFSPTVSFVRCACFSFTAIKRVDLCFTRHIEGESFKDCKCLEQVKMSPYIEFIDSYAFSGCERLREIHFENNSVMFGASVFSGCRSLTAVTLPMKLRVLPRDMFNNCKSLRHIDLPVTLETISDKCFAVSGLDEIVIPKRVKRLGTDCFTYCENLKTVVFESRQDIFIASKCFTGCSSLRLVQVHSKKLAAVVRKVLKQSQLDVTQVVIEVL